MKKELVIKENLYKLFKLYLADKLTPDQLVSNLQTLCKGMRNKSYWWRFFANDTGANDWRSIRANLGSLRNSQYLIECMQIAIKDKSIIVYYS
jgi:hypothetical protein